MQERQDTASSTVTVYEYTTTFYRFSTTSTYLPLSTAEFYLPTNCRTPSLSLQPKGLDSSTVECSNGTATKNCATSIFLGADPDCYPSGYSAQVLPQDLVVSNANGTTRLRSPQPSTAAVPQAGVATVTITDSVTATVSLGVTLLYYSPALCPAGYTEAAHHSGDQVYTVTCCRSIAGPGGYVTGTNGQCWYPTEVPGSTISNSYLTLTDYSLDTSTITFASAILVAHDNSQYSSLLNAQTALPRAPGPLDDTSVKVALGVCIPLGVLLIGIMVFYLRRRIQKAKARKTQATPRRPNDKGASAKLMGETAELDPKKELNEAGGQARPHEADALHVRAELDGDWRGWEVSEERRGEGDGRAV